MESTYCTNVSVHPMQLPYCAQLRQSWDPSLCWFVGESHIFTWAPSLSQIVQKYLCLPMYILAQLCDLRLCVCVCVCSVAMATAQHISDHRTALGLKALPGFCQSIIHSRVDMSEGKGRRVETAVRRMHARAHTHTPLSLHTHWISSYSSWLETPMAIAIGIHSPRMLGQLCRYWMRLSWFGLFCMQLEIKTTWYLIQIYIPSCQNTSNSSSLCLPHHTVYWILHKIDRHFLEIQQCPHHGLTKSDGKCSKNIYQQNLDMSFKYSWYVH